VEKAAHKYLENLAKGDQKGTGIGHEHKVFENVGHPVESAIDRDGNLGKAIGIAEGDVKPGGWLLGSYVSDKYWPLVKSGEITGYSVGGACKRKEKVEAVEKLHKENIMTILTNLVSKAFPETQKVNYSDYKRTELKKATTYAELVIKAVSYKEITSIAEVKTELARKTWYLMDSIWSIMDDREVINKVELVSQSVEQYLKDIKDLKKLEKNINEGESDMTQEQLDKLSGTLEKLTGVVITLNEKVEKMAIPLVSPVVVVPPVLDPLKVEEKATVDPKLDELAKKVDGLVTTVNSIAKSAAPRVGDESRGIDEKLNTTRLTKNTAFSFCRDIPKAS